MTKSSTFPHCFTDMFRPDVVPESAQTRRSSNISSASSRSYSNDAAPTLATIANDREANLRTPRPHTTSAAMSGKVSTTLDTPTTASKARIMQWQQRRDASDTTIEAREGVAGGSAHIGPTESSYPSDSLGRLSTTSSVLASGSEFGHGLRAGSETGHDRVASSASAVRKSRRVAPPELLVVVRPPPSKQSNPLNLQIQLVTPQQPNVNGPRVSGESSRDELPASVTNTSLGSSSGGLRSPGTQLRRSNSVSSSRSAISEASSAGLSTASGSSTGRRVTPLYNLCFHSIMPTTVTDAGTDQKVAKFGKRGVEIDGFGLLVPHELDLGVNDLASIDRRRRSSVIAGGGPGSLSGGSDFNSPEGRSDVSQARSTEATTVHSDPDSGSGSGVQLAEKEQEPPTSFDAMSPQAKEPSNDLIAGFGGKLLRGFKRFSLNAAGPPPPKNATSLRSGTTVDSATPTNIMARVRGAANKVKDGDSIVHEDGEVMSVNGSALGDGSESDIPQLAVGAGLRSDGTRRTHGYYWNVRRWNRRLGDGDEDIEHVVPGRHEAGANPILNSCWKRFNIVNRMGGNEIHPPASQIPIRFEWTRTESRKKSAATSSSVQAGRHGRAATDIGSGSNHNTGSRSSVRASFDARSAGHETAPGSAMGNSSSEALRLPVSHSRPASLYNTGGTRSPVRASMDRVSAASHDGEESDPEDSETKWACHLVLGPTTRIPIGSLAPTPHHPKLVAQLTVPYPLPDLSQSGLGSDGAGLTREELKDIISVTALFVIVREAFGGLAKRRKGDSVLKFGAAVAQR